MYFSSHQEKERQINDYMDREIAGARKRDGDAETALMQEQGDMRNAENVQSTTSMPENILEEMLNTVRDSLSDVASSDDKEAGEDEENDKEDTELGKVSEDNKPGWVMGTICKMVQQNMESFRQKRIRRDKLPQPERGVTADYILERDMKDGMAKWMVLAVVKPQTDKTAVTPSPATFGELIHTLVIVLGQSQMPQRIRNPLNSGPESARWWSGQCGLVSLYIRRPLE